jgi:cysteinyl-tRNA synthetase
LQQNPQEWLQDAASDDAISAQEIEELIVQRQRAKLDGNYALADEIRQGLAAAGVVLEDSREGTQWKRSTA